MTHSKQKMQQNTNPKGVAGIVRNSVFGIFARAVDTVMRFVILAMIVRYLGPESFGDFAFITAFGAIILSLAEFGIEPVMVREMSASPLRQQSILGSVLTLRLLCSILIFFTLLLFVWVKNWNQDITIGLPIETAAQLFVMMQMTMIGVFRANEKMEYDLVTSCIHQCLLFCIIGGVIFFDLGFIWIFITRLLTEFGKVMIQSFIVHRKLIPITFNFDFTATGYFLKEAFPVLLLSFVLAASQKINIFFLKYFHGPVEISYFDIPQRILMSVNLISMMVVMAIFPVLCRQAKTSMDDFSHTYEKSLKFSSIFGIAISFLMMFWSEEIITVFFGIEFRACSVIMQVLSIIILLHFIIGLMNYTLTAVGMQRKPIAGAWVGMGINCIAALLLVPRYAHHGAAVAVLTGNMSFLVVNQWMIFRHVTRVPVLPVLAKPLFCSVVLILLSLPFKNFGLPGMVLGIPVALSGFFGFLCLLKVFTPREMQIFLAMIRNRRFDRSSP